jgi:hypothetical protein
MRIAENGDGAAQILSSVYSTNEIAKAAMKGLVFENVGNFARSLVVGVIGDSGKPEDAENVLMHLIGNEKAWNRKKYREHGLQEFGNAIIIHRADKSEIVREMAISAIKKIFGNGECALSTESGRALVRCTLVDPSEKVRVAAAGIIAKHAKPVVFSQLFAFMVNAEKTSNALIIKRGKEAAAEIVANMKADRPRGSFLRPLIMLSDTSETMWDFGSKTIMELFESSTLKDEIRIMLLREKMKLEGQEKEKDELQIERMGALLEKMGKNLPAVGAERKKITAEAEFGPGEVMVPPAKMRHKVVEEDPVVVQRGPVVDAIYRAGRTIKKVLSKGPRR